jgi:hypothetical protein
MLPDRLTQKLLVWVDGKRKFLRDVRHRTKGQHMRREGELRASLATFWLKGNFRSNCSRVAVVHPRPWEKLPRQLLRSIFAAARFPLPLADGVQLCPELARIRIRWQAKAKQIAVGRTATRSALAVVGSALAMAARESAGRSTECRPAEETSA